MLNKKQLSLSASTEMQPSYSMAGQIANHTVIRTLKCFPALSIRKCGIICFVFLFELAVINILPLWHFFFTLSCVFISLALLNNNFLKKYLRGFRNYCIAQWTLAAQPSTLFLDSLSNRLSLIIIKLWPSSSATTKEPRLERRLWSFLFTAIYILFSLSLLPPIPTVTASIPGIPSSHYSGLFCISFSLSLLEFFQLIDVKMYL